MSKAKNDGKVASSKHLTILPPKFRTAVFTIVGDAPYVQHKFSDKAKRIMIETQEAGSTRKKGAKREAKNFEDCYEGAKHISKEGWCGIPAPSFRNAMISACRMVGFKMTHAKLSVFVDADGLDASDGTPLVKITKGKPHRSDMAARNSTGVIDIRSRPMWDPGWEAQVRVRFDEDQFTLDDVTNLMMRAGMQVGIGEGRPDSRMSAGLGWGTFILKDKG